MKPSKEKMSELKAKTDKCLRLNSVNDIIDIMCYSQEEKKVGVEAVRALQKIFTHFLFSDECEKPDDQVKVWLQEQFRTACGLLVENLGSTHLELQNASLEALTTFLGLEGQKTLTTPDAQALLKEMLEKMLSTSVNMERQLLALAELTKHADVHFVLMKATKERFGKVPSKARSEVFLNNVLCLLEKMELPLSDGQQLTSFLTTSDPKTLPTKMTSLREQKNTFTATWMEFLRSELTVSQYRRVLKRLDGEILSFFSSPLLLADFLTQSYNIGGAVSLLAMDGLFTLMHRYNLNYPDFYAKLYAMFEPNIFDEKYRVRFFQLADLCLSSTHLPAQLVASFIKRLSRLALFAPVEGAMLSIAFVCNLMVRHPTCAILVNRPNHTVNSDPFRGEETDPSKTAAIESSLWEIKTLQNHYCPEVAKAANRINSAITQEQLLSDFDVTTEELLEREMSGKIVSKEMLGAREASLKTNFFALS